MFHKLMCWLGWHRSFVQVDRWGQATVCAYCHTVKEVQP